MGRTDVSIVTGPLLTVNEVARGFVALVCAASAGVHAALVPEHLEESTALGVAFAASAACLAGCALGLRSTRSGAGVPAVTVAVLLATVVSYVLSRTSGLPLLVPEPEALDSLGVVTTSAEGLAAAAAAWLLLDRKESR